VLLVRSLLQQSSKTEWLWLQQKHWWKFLWRSFHFKICFYLKNSSWRCAWVILWRSVLLETTFFQTKRALEPGAFRNAFMSESNETRWRLNAFPIIFSFPSTTRAHFCNNSLSTFTEQKYYAPPEVVPVKAQFFI